jgi:hypothetical protein
MSLCHFSALRAFAFSLNQTDAPSCFMRSVPAKMVAATTDNALERVCADD